LVLLEMGTRDNVKVSSGKRPFLYNIQYPISEEIIVQIRSKSFEPDVTVLKGRFLKLN